MPKSRPLPWPAYPVHNDGLWSTHINKTIIYSYVQYIAFIYKTKLKILQFIN